MVGTLGTDLPRFSRVSEESLDGRDTREHGVVMAFLMMTAPGRVGNTDIAITLDLSRLLLHGTVALDPQCSECAIGVGGIRGLRQRFGWDALAQRRHPTETSSPEGFSADTKIP